MNEIRVLEQRLKDLDVRLVVVERMLEQLMQKWVDAEVRHGQAEVRS